MFSALYKKIVHSALLLLIVVAYAAAQKQPVHKGLLWKIEGEGITKPSYLYITIPSSDKRVYEFSDSLYWAFEQCEALAIDIAPDSLKTPLFDRYFNKNESNKVLQKILPEGTYQNFSQQLYNSTGYTLDQTAISNPAFLNSLVSRKINIGKFDYNIKLPEYFIRLAKAKERPIISLENLQEKVELNLYTDFETDEILNMGINGMDKHRLQADSTYGEGLIRLYRKGDLEGYLKEIDHGGNIAEREQATHNRIMAERLKVLLPKKAVFIAVQIQVAGGQGGLLELLQNMGFRLQPIAAKYIEGVDTLYQNAFSPDKLPWPSFVSEKFGYTTKFPTEPTQESPRGIISESNYAQAPASAANYFAAIIQNPLDKEADEILLERILERSERIPKASRLTSKKKVQTYFEGDTINGLDIVYTQDAYNYTRMRIYVREKKYIYFFVVESRKEATLSNETTRQFFDAITFTELPKIEKTAWREFVWEEAACKFNVLGEPVFSEEFTSPMRKVSRQGGRDISYTFNNPIDGSSFRVQCTQLANGLFYRDSSIFFSDWEENLSLNEVTKLLYKNDLSDSLCIAREYGAEDPINKGLYRLYYRGNRLYFIMIQHRKEDYDTLAIQDFLKSFSFLPFDTAKLAPHTSPNKDYTLLLPEGQSFVPDRGESHYKRDKDIVSQLITEPKSGIVFNLGRGEISKYRYFPSEDSLKHWIESTFMAPEDSLLWATPVLSYSPYEVLDLGICPQNPICYIRARIYLVGNTFYILQAFTAPNDLRHELVERVFNSFQIKNASPICAPTLYSRKEILDNLFGDAKKEILVEKKEGLNTNAYWHFQDFSFQTSDLPYFYQLLSAINPKDSAAAHLLDFYLKNMPEGDIDSFMPLLTDLYRMNFLQGQSDTQKRILWLLSKYDNETTKVHFKKLLLEYVPTVEEGHRMQPLGHYQRSKLGDSGYLFPEVLELLNNHKNHSWLLPFLVGALDSAIIEKEILLPYWAVLETEFEKHYDKLPKESHSKTLAYDRRLELISMVANLVNLLCYKPTLSRVEQNALQRLLALDNTIYPREYKLEAIGTLLRHNIRPDKNSLTQLAESVDFWHQLYHPFQKYQKTKWFPKKQLNQLDMATSKMMAFILYYDELVFENIVLLEKRQVVINGKEGLVYFFKIKERSWDEDEESTDWHLGVCGLYSDAEDMLGDGSSPVLDWDKMAADADKLAEQQAALLKRLEVQ